MFSNIGGQNRNNIAALDASTGNATSWNPNANNGPYWAAVYALAVSGSTIYVGGFFYNIGGQSRNNIAALDASSGIPNPAWNPNVGSTISALAVSGNTVYAGGAQASPPWMLQLETPIPGTAISFLIQLQGGLGSADLRPCGKRQSGLRRRELLHPNIHHRRAGPERHSGR